MLTLVIIIVIYLILIYPNNNKQRKAKMKPYHDVYLAHRGLFNNIDIPENSLLAFKKVVLNNMGCELDVQLTTDNQLVVFHDETLLRMCGINKKLTDCSYAELQQYNLLNTNEKIPLFSDVLDVLKDDTPLVIEIKAEGDYLKTTKMTIEMMRKTNHLYTMESFHPGVVKYLKENNPDIIRGQLSYNYLKDSKNKNNIFMKFALTYLLGNFITKPDYVAYDINNTSNLSFRIVSQIYKAECVAWTVKSESDLKRIRKYYKQIIFDSFLPKK